MDKYKKEKMKLIDALYKDFRESAENYIDLAKDGNFSPVVRNKNYSHGALKRKIVYLRQELKNFDEMLSYW